MFNDNNNDYNLPNLNLKHGLDKFGNECFIFRKNNGNIKINDENYNFQNINVFINDEIFIEFECGDFKLKNENNICFVSDDGWEVNIKCNSLKNNTGTINGYASDFSCKKGKFNESDIFRSFYFIENLELDNYDENINLNGLDGLKLIVRNYEHILNIDGCFYFEEKGYNNKYDIAIKNIKALLNYYSANLASMRITCKCTDDEFIELKFTPISKYTHFKCNIPFFSYGGNFANFINSTYNKYVSIDKKQSIDYIMDYLSYLHREKYGDNQIIISCMILEMLNNLYDVEIDSRIPAFIQKLNNVLNQLDLNSEKLYDFFKKKEILCNDGVVSEIYAIRNQAFHGKKVSNEKISSLLSTFVNILFLKLLETDCYIQLPICGSKNINTKDFVNLFTMDEIKNNYHSPNYDYVIEINKKPYFPLNHLKNKDIYENDEYILVEFNKESNILLFRETGKYKEEPN